MPKHQIGMQNPLYEESKLINFCNGTEKRHYLALRAKLNRENPIIQQADLNNIMAHVLKNRVPFDHLFSNKTFIKHFFLYILPCLGNKIKRRKDEDHQKMKLFNNGLKRYYHELDITRIINSIRISKVL